MEVLGLISSHALTPNIAQTRCLELKPVRRKAVNCSNVEFALKRSSRSGRFTERWLHLLRRVAQVEIVARNLISVSKAIDVMLMIYAPVSIRPPGLQQRRRCFAPFHKRSLQDTPSVEPQSHA